MDNFDQEKPSFDFLSLEEISKNFNQITPDEEPNGCHFSALCKIAVLGKCPFENEHHAQENCEDYQILSNLLEKKVIESTLVT